MKRSTEEFKRELCDAITYDLDVRAAILDIVKRSAILNPEIRQLLDQSSVRPGEYLNFFLKPRPLPQSTIRRYGQRFQDLKQSRLKNTFKKDPIL